MRAHYKPCDIISYRYRDYHKISIIRPLLIVKQNTFPIDAQRQSKWLKMRSFSCRPIYTLNARMCSPLCNYYKCIFILMLSPLSGGRPLSKFKVNNVIHNVRKLYRDSEAPCCRAAV